MIRKDIQGLRAIAVGAVILFHFWPEHLTGGYVGVDVFFVISGFLITLHLLRKPPISRKAVVDFWARRVKRLIPAATVVLFVTVIASLVWLPETMLQRTAYETAAAAVYGENWMLAATATDYLAKDNAPTPIQHYWSLSIEEQYYAVWPVIIGAVFLLSRRFLSPNKLLAIVMGGIFAASLAYSIYLTATNPAAAYFVTTTRIWELTIGGIIALIATRLVVPSKVAVPMAWAGLSAIVVTTILFNKQTPFPGFTALLPTLGTALVILAATDNMRWSPYRLLALKPAQFLGDISYSVYLWHWPAIVIAPFVLSVEYLTLIQKLVLVILVIGLSYLTKLLIEDPVRNSGLMMKTNTRTFAYGIVSIVIVVATSLGIAAFNQSRVALAEKTLQSAVDSNDPCLGAAALRNDECESIAGDKLLMSPALAETDKARVYDDGCRTKVPYTDFKKCSYGDLGSTTKIALVGNSHAVMWFGAIEQIAINNGWKLDTYLISGCSTILEPIDLDTSEKSTEGCLEWNKWALNSILSVNYSMVVASNRSAFDLKDVSQDKQFSSKVDAYEAYLRKLRDSGQDVLVIRDAPEAGDNIPDCLAENAKQVGACDAERNEVLAKDPLYTAAKNYKSKSVDVLDLSARFCDENTCYAVIGGVIVYFDEDHVTDTYAKTLVPDIEPVLQRMVQK